VNYFAHADEFLAWAERVARVTRLENPARLVAWNAHKSYLRALSGAGVPVVLTVFVQPFIDTVPGSGETSLIFFDGQFSHAVRKLPAAGDFRVQEHYGGTVAVHDPSPAEMTVAQSALDAAPEASTYARIDLVGDPDAPLLMEAELIEPFLFLGSHEPATARFAEVLAARAG
jgi:glutathione synthase/RimK-type ligase-like ATP-grasp enzyme